MSNHSASQNQPTLMPNNQSIHLLECMSDGFVLLDAACHVVYINNQGETISQRTPDELLGKNIWDTFPGAVDSVFYTRLHEAIETQKPVQFVEYSPSLHKWIEVRAYPSAENLAVYFLDVTHRIVAQKEREETLALLDTIIDTAPIGFCIFDNELRYQRIMSIAAKKSPKVPLKKSPGWGNLRWHIRVPV